jgi:Glutaminyl-tRNA synthetase, non-specific RNA binding region part 1
MIVAAMEYLLHHPNEAVNAVEFETASGIGVVVSAEEIEDNVSY